MNKHFRTPALETTPHAAIRSSGDSVETYTDSSEIPPVQDIAAASVRAALVAGGGF